MRRVTTVLLCLLGLATGCGSSDSWRYTIREVDGHITFDTTRFTLVVEGKSYEPIERGELVISGEQSAELELGDAFRHRYANGTSTITFAGRELRIEGSGESLVYAGQTIDLTGERKRLVIDPAGKLRVEKVGN